MSNVLMSASLKRFCKLSCTGHEFGDHSPFMLGSTWRFMGSYKWGYKSPNMGYNYSYPTYNSTYTYLPMNLQVSALKLQAASRDLVSQASSPLRILALAFHVAWLGCVCFAASAKCSWSFWGFMVQVSKFERHPAARHYIFLGRCGTLQCLRRRQPAATSMSSM